MKKYQRLKCATCKRDIDKLVDVTHYTPDQCTITLGCEGRLQLLEYRSNAGIAVAPEVGVTDWRPRGSTAAQSKPIQEEQLIGLETGELKQLVLAVPFATAPASDAVVELELAVIADAPKAFRQYVFRKEGSFSTISGVESGLEKKALRFTAYGATPDVIEVFVNGVKREQGTDPEDFQVFTGSATGSAPPNTIVFNTPIDAPGVTQVDIVVSKEAASSAVTMTFLRNVADGGRSGAYENVSYVDRFMEGNWVRYYLFTLDLDDVTSELKLNSILVPQERDAFFLLARQPYTKVDRYGDIVVALEDLSAERDYIKYYAVDSVTTARVTESALTNLYPPLRFGKFAIESTIKTATAGVEEQLVVDGRVIIGPDA
jgi:hypothetical protein